MYAGTTGFCLGLSGIHAIRNHPHQRVCILITGRARRWAGRRRPSRIRYEGGLTHHDEFAAVAVQHRDPQADAAEDAGQHADRRIGALAGFEPADRRLTHPAELGELALAEHVPASDLAQ